MQAEDVVGKDHMVLLCFIAVNIVAVLHGQSENVQ